VHRPVSDALVFHVENNTERVLSFHFQAAKARPQFRSGRRPASGDRPSSPSVIPPQCEAGRAAGMLRSAPGAQAETMTALVLINAQIGCPLMPRRSIGLGRLEGGWDF
jgi:hypothetical protein